MTFFNKNMILIAYLLIITQSAFAMVEDCVVCVGALDLNGIGADRVVAVHTIMNGNVAPAAQTHSFHVGCIKQWAITCRQLGKGLDCPTCRRQITKENSPDLFGPPKVLRQFLNATKKGQLDRAQVFLARYPLLVGQTDEHGMTALMYAAMYGAKKMMHPLLYYVEIADRDMYVNHQDNTGKTALMYAAERGRTPTINMLLAMGADVESVDNYGKTALMLSAKSGYEISIRALINKGQANIDQVDAHGRTALFYAASYPRSYGLNELVKYGAVVDMHNNAGMTPLMRAAAFGCKENVALLIALGVNVHAQDQHGRTARAIALLRNYGDIADLLGAAEAAGLAPAILL